MAKILGRWLDTTQKKIVLGGMVCFLLVGLIPPLMDYHSHSHCGYGIIFLDGGSPYGGGYVGGIGHYERIDFYRLIVEWILVIVLTGGFLFLSKEKKSK
jgi:hypothetical protein